MYKKESLVEMGGAVFHSAAFIYEKTIYQTDTTKDASSSYGYRYKTAYGSAAWIADYS